MDYIEKISTRANSLLATAIKGWFEGLPLEEVALMNRITQKFQVEDQECNLGFGTSIVVNSYLQQLHRRGPRGIDQYGSDLAITVLVNGKQFCKTAFIQFKVGVNETFSVQNKQLLRAFQTNIVKDNFHLFYTNKTNGKTHVLDFDNRDRLFHSLGDVNIEDGSTNFNTNNFWKFYIWIYLWLHCEIGQNSFDNNFQVEKSLYLSSELDIDVPIALSDRIGNDLNEFYEYPLADNWLFLEIIMKE